MSVELPVSHSHPRISYSTYQLIICCEYIKSLTGLFPVIVLYFCIHWDLHGLTFVRIRIVCRITNYPIIKVKVKLSFVYRDYIGPR